MFERKGGERIEISHAGMTTTADGGQNVPWDEVKGLSFNNSSFGNTLVVTHFDKGVIGSRTTKLKLSGLGKQEAGFKEAVSHYWHRHQVMRAQQVARSAADEAEQSPA